MWLPAYFAMNGLLKFKSYTGTGVNGTYTISTELGANARIVGVVCSNVAGTDDAIFQLKASVITLVTVRILAAAGAGENYQKWFSIAQGPEGQINSTGMATTGSEGDWPFTSCNTLDNNGVQVPLQFTLTHIGATATTTVFFTEEQPAASEPI